MLALIAMVVVRCGAVPRSVDEQRVQQHVVLSVGRCGGLGPRARVPSDLLGRGNEDAPRANDDERRWSGVSAGVSILYFIVLWVIIGLPTYFVFKKAGPNGDPAWAAFVPIYGFYILLKVVGRPGWWLIWIFIPIANLHRDHHRLQRPVEELRPRGGLHLGADLPQLDLPRDPRLGELDVPRPVGGDGRDGRVAAAATTGPGRRSAPLSRAPIG